VQAVTSACTPIRLMAAREPQGVTLTREQFEARLRQAAPGDRISYHLGYLAIDRVRSSSRLSEPARRELITVANTALALAKRGDIHLVQQRVEPAIFRYFAVKSHANRGLGTPA
jgi:hypothetical protein